MSVTSGVGKEHRYPIHLKWTGNTGTGTREYRGYERAHEYSVPGKPMVPGSSDPAFRGDETRYNPEELLVMSLSSCHMLWFLHLASKSGVVVTAYEDDASGTMLESEGGGGRFVEVVLRPCVTFESGTDRSKVSALHERAHHLCFIANSGEFSGAL